MRRSKSDHHHMPARLKREGDTFDDQHSGRLDASPRQQETAVAAGSPKTRAPAPGMTPAAHSLVAEAMHGKQVEAPALSSPGAAAHEKRGQAAGVPVPRLSGKDILKLLQNYSLHNSYKANGQDLCSIANLLIAVLIRYSARGTGRGPPPVADLRLRLPHRHQQHVAPAGPAVLCEGGTLRPSPAVAPLLSTFSLAPCMHNRRHGVALRLTLDKPCAAESSRRLPYAEPSIMACCMTNIHHMQ